MNESQVIAILGLADSVNKTTTKDGINAQWVYNKSTGKSDFYYFENGKLVSFQISN
jgi:hypothetical protein